MNDNDGDVGAGLSRPYIPVPHNPFLPFPPS